MNKPATEDYLPGAVCGAACGFELKPDQFEAQPAAIISRSADGTRQVVFSKST